MSMDDTRNRTRRIMKKIGIIALVLIGFSILSLYVDQYDLNDVKEIYCREKYGDEFEVNWDRDIRHPYCSRILEDGTLEKYYFNVKSAESMCEEKFWKIDDCEGDN